MSKPRVLIVEDNVDNFELVRFLLERAGYQVLSAANGIEGLDAAKREQPDLILMDLSMPELDGWNATARLKADEATRAIPVLALTAHTLPGDRKRAIDAGCDGYISKPINVASFDKLVATLLRQAKAGLQS
jgi:CheY-like chemotaxis protein